MSGTIKAQMHSGDKSGLEYLYSVKEYAEYILKNAGTSVLYTKAVPLVKAMLNYGTYAQAYFGVTDTPANDTEYMSDEDRKLPDIDPDVIGAYDPDMGELPDSIYFEGASISLKGELILSLYFKSDSDLQFSCGDMTIDTVKNGGYQVARLRRIKAYELALPFVLLVNDGESSYSVHYAVGNNCCNVLNGDYDAGIKNVISALVSYCLEAGEFLYN